MGLGHMSTGYLPTVHLPTIHVLIQPLILDVYFLRFKVKLMSKMKMLHIKVLILLIIIVKQNHSMHINKMLAATFDSKIVCKR